MTDRYAKLSFVANGHIIQSVHITAPHISAKRLHEMLVNGEALTTVQEGRTVCVDGDLPIAEVVYVEAELDYTEFQLEDEYTLPTPVPETFNMSRLAHAAAIGEYLDEPDKSVGEVLTILAQAGGEEPRLNVEEMYSGLSGNQLLKEIDLMERGLKTLMKDAYDAGAAGREIV